MKDPLDVKTMELISKRGRPKSGTAVPGFIRMRKYRARLAAELAASPTRPVFSEIIDLSCVPPWQRG